MMEDKCPYCGADAKPITGDMWQYYKCGSCRIINCDLPDYHEIDKTGLCKDGQIANLEKRCQALAAHAVLDEEQIANLQASRDRWRELAAAQKVIIAYEHRNADYGINAMIQAYGDRDKAVAALKEAGEWEI